MEEKKSTFKVLFYLKKNAPKKDGTVPIMIRTTIDGVEKTRSAKVSVNPGRWDKARMRVTGRDAYATKINNALDLWERNIGAKYDTLFHYEGYVTAEKVDNAVMGTDAKKMTLLTFFKQHNDEFKLKVGRTRAENTHRMYCDVYNHVSNFLKLKYNLSDIPLIELKESFIKNFDFYLRCEKNFKANTVRLYMVPLKRLTAMAKDDNIIAIDPFKHFVAEKESVDIGYLTMDEVEAMISADLPTKLLEIVRDMFVFCCFTGISHTDLKKLTRQNIQDFFDGNNWLIYRRRKTDIKSSIPLLEIPKKILEKYRDYQIGNRAFPVPEYDPCNNLIKIVAGFARIDKHLTFHMSRHTFATMMLSKGVPIETVSHMLGHSNITTTQIYARITNQKISDDMQKLSETLHNFEKALVDKI